jgi:hypothetical protein
MSRISHPIATGTISAMIGDRESVKINYIDEDSDRD